MIVVVIILCGPVNLMCLFQCLPIEKSMAVCDFYNATFVIHNILDAPLST